MLTNEFILYFLLLGLVLVYYGYTNANIVSWRVETNQISSLPLNIPILAHTHICWLLKQKNILCPTLPPN